LQCSEGKNERRGPIRLPIVRLIAWKKRGVKIKGGTRIKWQIRKAFTENKRSEESSTGSRTVSSFAHATIPGGKRAKQGKGKKHATGRLPRPQRRWEVGCEGQPGFQTIGGNPIPKRDERTVGEKGGGEISDLCRGKLLGEVDGGTAGNSPEGRSERERSVQVASQGEKSLNMGKRRRRLCLGGGNSQQGQQTISEV